MYNESYSTAATRNSKSYKPLPKYGRPDNEVQVITGKDFEDCQQKLYDTYRHNYTILWKKPVFKARFLFGHKEYWEVGYSVGSGQNSLNPSSAQTEQDDFKKSRDELLKKTTASVTQTMQIASLDKKIEEMRKTMETTMQNIAAATNAGDKHISIQKIEELLQENEFTFSYINNITNRLKDELTVAELDDFDLVQEKVVDWIGESIKVAPNDMHPWPHVIILVGPTGVGKTTTIAKLAGKMIKAAKKDENLPYPRIRFITTDITRVGAEEQLRHFGEWLEIKVDKASTDNDIKNLLNTYKDNFDVIFIDTAGYSPNDSENIGKMRKRLELKGVHPDIYLAFAASTKSRDMKEIIQNYEPFNFSSIIITKWDETNAIGNVISVLAEKNKVVSYITDGQQVPARLEKATVNKFLQNLIDFKINREHIDEKFPEEN